MRRLQSRRQLLKQVPVLPWMPLEVWSSLAQVLVLCMTAQLLRWSGQTRSQVPRHGLLTLRSAPNPCL